jgi:tetratricopeptide (TPR) repeat protein
MIGMVAVTILPYVAHRKSLIKQEQAISDFNKALEINPRDAMAYVIRGTAYYFQKEYEKSWKDVEKAEYLGYRIDPEFLDDLRKASGRKN